MCRWREYVHGCSETSGVVDPREYVVLGAILVHVPGLLCDAEGFLESMGRCTYTVQVGVGECQWWDFSPPVPDRQPVQASTIMWLDRGSGADEETSLAVCAYTHGM